MTAAVDYSDKLNESAQDGCWKTARNVSTEDFSQVTRRLRYQAKELGLRIKIRTDRQEHTISFLTESVRCQKTTTVTTADTGVG